jgi:Cu+-exporting ATPase
MHITLPSAAAAPAGTTPQGRAWSLPVQGMTCASCVARVEKVARLVPGVLQADVNLATETLHLQTSAAFDPLPLKQVVERAGYTLATTELQLPISDMSCASCVARVEKALRQVPGVLDASVNLATETASVTLAGEAVDPAPLVAAVTRAGYGVAAPLAAQARSQPWLSEGRRVLLAAAGAGHAGAVLAGRALLPRRLGMRCAPARQHGPAGGAGHLGGYGLSVYMLMYDARGHGETHLYFEARRW